MRLQQPQLPAAPTKDQFSAGLVFKLKQQLTGIVNQLNNLTEGQVSAVQNATSGAPKTDAHQQGDYVRNKAPAVLGSSGAQYVITGWLCVAAGTPGAWVELRSLTGT